MGTQLPKKNWSALLRTLQGTSRVDVLEAAKDLSNFSRRNISLADALVKALRTGRRPLNRAAAAYALGFLGNRRAIPALEKALADKAESRSVRSDAAEALAYLASNGSIPLLTRQLEDPSKDVRLWCAFALGVAGTLDRRRAAIALPALRRLEMDHRVVRGFWPVAKEAEWAIARIEGREKDADRIEAEIDRVWVRPRRRS
ncbi:MAG: HEAT repeat domain-containing protein [Candidatus Acidiferrales bacterium]